MNKMANIGKIPKDFNPSKILSKTFDSKVFDRIFEGLKSFKDPIKNLWIKETLSFGKFNGGIKLKLPSKAYYA